MKPAPGSRPSSAGAVPSIPGTARSRTARGVPHVRAGISSRSRSAPRPGMSASPRDDDISKLGRMNRFVSAGVLALVVVSSTFAQQADVAGALRARIDRIFVDRAYEAPRFGPARWLPDGTAYAIVENARGGGSEIARYDAASGA